MVEMVSKTRKNRNHLPAHVATMSGLSDWHKHVFEHLGWMVLAKAKGYDLKVKAYKMSVKNLIASIKHVMGEYEDHDRKHDLKVLLMNVELLERNMNKVL